MPLINGTPGHDNLVGSNLDDTILAGSGNDTVTSNAGNDSVRGFIGDDYILGNDGNDTLYGGVDTLAVGQTDFDTVFGGNGDDRIYGMISADYLSGDAGNDILVGGAGNDTMTGGTGGDTLIGNTGNDYMFGDDNADRLLGLEGNDTLSGGEGADTLYGGDAGDWLFGDNGSDNLFGDAGDDTIYGAAGNDALWGSVGNDVLDGGADNDTLRGFDGNDALYGGAGRDAIYGGNGVDAIFGGDGADTLDGGADNDVIDGGAGNDLVLDSAGDDTIDGASGNDTIIAKTGDDLVAGGAGDDILLSIRGDDTLSGGVGNDTYYVHGDAGDVVFITDTNGIDTLDFSSASTAAIINLDGGTTSYVDGRSIVLSGDGVSLQPVDLMILQDLSGSFGDDVATVQGLVPSLVSGIQSVQPDALFGVSSFVDKPMSPFGDNGSGDYVFQINQVLTSNATDFQNAINNLIVRYGGDGPEAQIESLMQLGLHTADAGFRIGSFKAVVLTTDAAYHQAGDGTPYGLVPNDGDGVIEGSPAGTYEDYPDVTQLRNALLAGGIVPIFAVTSSQIATYQTLVGQLGFGTVVQLSSNSSDIVNAVTSGLATVTDTTIENAIGTIYADTITANEANNTINGLAGDDVIHGLAGNDTLIGGVGGDHFLYTETWGAGFDTITDFSLAGDDKVVLSMGTGYSAFNSGSDVYLYFGDSTVLLQGAGPFDVNMIEFV